MTGFSLQGFELSYHNLGIYRKISWLHFYGNLNKLDPLTRTRDEGVRAPPGYAGCRDNQALEALRTGGCFGCHGLWALKP